MVGRGGRPSKESCRSTSKTQDEMKQSEMEEGIVFSCVINYLRHCCISGAGNRAGDSAVG